MVAVMVDHIIELKDGGDRLSEENAQSLCWKCHGIKTAENKRRNKHGVFQQQGSEDSIFQTVL